MEVVYMALRQGLLYLGYVGQPEGSPLRNYFVFVLGFLSIRNLFVTFFPFSESTVILPLERFFLITAEAFLFFLYCFFVH